MTEADRLAALAELDILDTPQEKDYDDLVRLASAICGTPISLVSLVDKERQWFKAAVGLAVKETPRNVSFCTHAIQGSDIFIVEDATGDSRFKESTLVTQDPNIRFYAGVPLTSPGGAAIGSLCVIDRVPRVLSESQKDALNILGAQVTAQLALRAKQKALERSISLFRSFMNYSPCASYIKDGDGKMIFYNRYLAEVSGVSESEWVGLKDHEIWPVEMATKFRNDDVAVLKGDVPVESEDISPSPEGGVIYWKSIKFPCVAESGAKMLAGISIDVTQEVIREARLENALREQQALSLELERLATTDSLTGLSTRHVFMERLEIEFADWKRSKHPLSIFILDVDNFKKRNDTCGHAAGDSALKTLGRVLKRCVRVGDVAARLGGEEFGVILPNTDIKGAQEMAERFQSLLSREEAGPLPLTVSLGIAKACTAVEHGSDMLARADEAMYAAKRSGKNRVVLAA